MKKIFRKISTLIMLFGVKLKTQSYKGVRYYHRQKGGDTLLIVFSAFVESKGKYVKRFNYLKTLQESPYSQLYIEDSYGYGGGYYLRYKGQQLPEDETKFVIMDIVKRYGYEHIITLGSSKGGSAALFHGISIGADEVICGACQYYVGTYLISQNNIECLKQMVKNPSDAKEIEILDSLIPQAIHSAYAKPRITLIYSKLEHTYPEHIQYLLRDLKSNGYNIVEEERDFQNHMEIGVYFAKYLNQRFIK